MIDEMNAWFCTKVSEPLDHVRRDLSGQVDFVLDEGRSSGSTVSSKEAKITFGTTNDVQSSPYRAYILYSTPCVYGRT